MAILDPRKIDISFMQLLITLYVNSVVTNNWLSLLPNDLGYNIWLLLDNLFWKYSNGQLRQFLTTMLILWRNYFANAEMLWL